ncbi:MAG: lytic transglycosylase domain-containing protein [Bdellovibrionota bacterium]
MLCNVFLFSTAQNLNAESYFNADLRGMRILTTDLEGISQGLYPQHVTQELDQEVSRMLKEKSSKNNLAPLQFIKGYLLWTQKQPTRAIELFSAIEPSDPLQVLAQYYLTQVHLELAKDQSNPNHIKHCSAAITLVETMKQTQMFFPIVNKNDVDVRSQFCLPYQLLLENKEPDFLSVLELADQKRLSDFNRKELLTQALRYYQSTRQTQKTQAMMDITLKYYGSESHFLDHVERVAQLTFPRSDKETPLVEAKDKAFETLVDSADRLRKQNKFISALSALVSGAINKKFEAYHSTLLSKIKALARDIARVQGLSSGHYKELLRLSDEDLYEIARYFWNQNINSEAHHLLLNITALYPNSKVSQKSHGILAQLYEDQQNWERAIFHHKKYLDHFTMVPIDDRSRFKIGWLYWLHHDPQKGLFWLTKDHDISESPHTKAQAAYWMAKIFEEKKDSSTSGKYHREIMDQYPLTFYTLLSSQKIQGHKVDLERKGPKLKPNPEHEIMTSIRRYFEVGLPTLAHSLFLNYRALLREEEIFEYTQFQHLAKKHSISIPNALDLIDKRFEEHGLEKTLVEMFFPVHYIHNIEQEAKKNALDPFLVMSLIKQESAFEAQAISRADAKGLMQLIDETAQDVAQKIHFPNMSSESLFVPQTNIELGTKYFSDMIKAYGGKVPYALAAYNAGPERINTWITRWGDLPMESFIELIPYQETRSYIKLIFRNYYFYHLLTKNHGPQDISAFGL